MIGSLGPEDVINQSLQQIGYGRRVGDVYEGTRASLLALDLYSQSRDEILRVEDWAFARRSNSLALLKAAGSPPYGGGAWSTAYPIVPYLYEYIYPADCIYLRNVRATPSPYPDFNPQPVLFAVGSDPAELNVNGNPMRVVLANIPNAIAVYTAQIIDTTTWEPLFTKSVVDDLAKKFTVALAQSAELLKETAGEFADSLKIADTRQEG